MTGLDVFERLAKAALSRGQEDCEDLNDWFSSAEFMSNMLLNPVDARFAEACSPSAILRIIDEIRILRAELDTPIAMGIKWSPIESSMMSGFSQIVAEDALTREFAKAKNVTVYYGEKRTYTSMAAFCAAHPKEGV